MVGGVSAGVVAGPSQAVVADDEMSDHESGRNGGGCDSREDAALSAPGKPSRTSPHTRAWDLSSSGTENRRQRINAFHPGARDAAPLPPGRCLTGPAGRTGQFSRLTFRAKSQDTARMKKRRSSPCRISPER